MDYLLPSNILGHQEIMRQIADRMQRLRLDHFNWSRALLAEKSGVNASTIKRFEKSGQITLENLILLAMALQAADEFLALFPLPTMHSIAELEKRHRKRQRGRISK